MDEIEELIAAGESILQERQSVTDEISVLNDTHIKLIRPSVNTFLSNTKQMLPSDETSISTDTMIKDSHNNYKKSYTDVPLLLDHSKLLTTIEEKNFDEVVSSIREEFAKLFSVGLSVNSSLINANRLVTAVVKRFCKDAITCEQILTEVNQCEESCKKNANIYNDLAMKMHHLLAEINNLSNTQEDQSNLINESEKKVLSLRDMIANLITDTGFKDIARQIISPRTNLVDLLEDSHLGLTLLSGELPNHVAKYQNDVLEKNHQRELHLKKEFDKLQLEYDDLGNSTQMETTRLNIHIEKLNKDISTYKYQLDLMEKEKTHAKLKFEEELKDSETVAAKLRESILTVKQDADRNVCLANKNLREAEESENIIQSKLDCLSEQVIAKDEQLHKNQDENASVIISLKDYAKKLENDLIKEKSQITRVEDIKGEYIEKLRHLEKSLEDAHKYKQLSTEEIQVLKNKSKELKEIHIAEMEEIQEKFSDLNSTICDKHSEVRSRDLKIMQLQSDLQLEEQKVFVINNESDILRRQIDRLQGRIEKLIENRPKGEQAIILHTDRSYSATMDNMQESSREKIQLEMQKILAEKDEEMKKLQRSLSSEILQKNNDLESVLKLVERLENQMVDVTSALNLSNGMAEASTRVASHLKKHSANLVDLQESSVKLHKDFHHMSEEKTEKESSSGNSYLKEDIDSWRSATKKARDEVRTARLELAKEKQKNSYLQIDLESARSVIDRKNRLKLLPLSKSLDDSKGDQTSADSLSTVLGNSENSIQIE